MYTSEQGEGEVRRARERGRERRRHVTIALQIASATIKP
jgi:hypothetical protein